MQGRGICPFMLHEVTLGRGLRMISILLPVLILLVSSYSNIIQLLVKSQFSADPVKALPFFFSLNSWDFLRAFFPPAIV